MTRKKTLMLRIVNRKKFTMFITIVLALFSTLMVTLTNQTQVNGQSKDNYVFVHIVEGNTLWDIAKEYNLGNKDIRKVVEDIMDENNMETAMLYPEQIIKVPVK
ncbi:MAG: LysM peptidoglycan-binding domain-containing protein [Clostridia bacterium]